MNAMCGNIKAHRHSCPTGRIFIEKIETNREQRDWDTHITTLSGDIGVTGVITGKAIYTGAINLAEAIRIGKGRLC